MRVVNACVPARFRVLETQLDFWYMNQNLRQGVQAAAALLTRSTCQKIMDIITFKERLETEMGQLGEARVARHYLDHVTVVGHGEEELSETFVRTAITIHSRLLKTEAGAIIWEAQDTHGQRSVPFDKSTKLLAIAQKARTAVDIHWTVAAL